MKFSWLHISDTHLEPGADYARDLTLSNLISAVERERSLGRALDAIFVTGDIVSAGKSAAYHQATRFFDALLDAAGLSRGRIFVIPGNHDVDRKRGGYLARTLTSIGDSDQYFDANQQKYHFDRLMQFSEWHDAYFEGIRSFSRDTTCGPVDVLDVHGGRVGVIPINTALFCSDDPDHEKLWVGRLCLDRAVAEIRLRSPDRTLALMHHPLSFLHSDERNAINRRLEDSVDIVLRGHLHESTTYDVASPHGRLVHLAAGAAYQKASRKKLALLGRIEGDSVFVLPLRYYEDEESWHRDPTLFPNSTSNEGSLRLSQRGRRAQEEPRSPATASTPKVPRAHDTDGATETLRTGLPARRPSHGALQDIVPAKGREARETQEGEQRALEELTKVFEDRERAMILTTKAGFPRPMMPPFTTALVFWDQVAREARNGVLPGGIRPILSVAAEMYPNNPVFVRYHHSRPSNEPNRDESRTPEVLGSMTAASARGDASAIASIAAFTGLGEQTVASTLSQADGRYRVRTLFSENWAAAEESADDEAETTLLSAEELAERTVAATRDDDDALESLSSITGLSLRGVKRQLNAANGRALLRNVFVDRWPEDEEQPDEPEGASKYSAEELAGWTAAAARDDDDAVQSLAHITGISRRWVRRHLNAAHGRVRVRNVFSENWPEDEPEDNNDYSSRELATWTAAAAREDEDALDALSVITGISRRWVKRRLNAAGGRAHVQTVFGDSWPEGSGALDAATLGSRTIASTRNDLTAQEALGTITGLSTHSISQRLEASDGRFRLRTIFRDVWPSEGEDESDGEGTLHSAEEMAGWTVAAARSDEGAVDSLVVITGLHPRWVRRYLNGAAGRTLLRNLFGHHWPSDD